MNLPRNFRALCAVFLFSASVPYAMCEPVANAVQPEAKPTVITVPVRVHLVQSKATPAMHTTMTEADVRRIFGKVNMVWSQAGICFEIESIVRTEAAVLSPELDAKEEFTRVNAMIPKSSLCSTALNVCYVKQVKPNGFFHSGLIVVKDTASLRPVEGGIDEPLPRVTSHEIGHALRLAHRQDRTNLMASGTTGFSLNDVEIETAREIATKFQRPASSDAAQTDSTK